MRRTVVPSVLAVVALVACGQPVVEDVPDAGADALPAECTGPSPKNIFARPVVNGNPTPTTFAIDRGQQLAVGALLFNAEWAWSNICTATLVAPDIVVTAAHCIYDEETDTARPPEVLKFGIGDDMRAPLATFDVASVHFQAEYDPDGRNLAHYDIAILKLTGDATKQYAGLRPIRLNAEALPVTLQGTMVEAVGYGLTDEAERYNTRKHWTSLQVTRVGARELVVYGNGETSVCFGDSGGPILMRSADGELRVIGVASWVAGRCLSSNHYCRVDPNMAWVESSGIAGPLSCGAVPGAGVCDGRIRRWCEGGAPTSAACGEKELCAGGDGTTAPTCTPDPCRGLDWQGACEDGAAVWCENGKVKRFDCGACGRGCGYLGAGVGYFCE